MSAVSPTTAANTEPACLSVHSTAQCVCTPNLLGTASPDVIELLTQAQAAYHLHQLDAALQALDLALQLQPNCKPALWQRAAVHAAAGSHQARFLDLRRLSSLQPDYPGILSALQEAAQACSQHRKAAVAAMAPQFRYMRTTRRQHHTGPCSLGGSTEGTHHLYQLLGVSAGASQEDIRQAYKQLAAKLHPDKWMHATVGDRAQAEERFKAISSAYQVLYKH
eukprot:GHRR01007777.1.p1 GENE.GHRR01007777.1~~GHRR01007777.1.p1  ORF type:complete len:222 (+),score=73.28 GHRR01007777.1:284-949(+)